MWAAQGRPDGELGKESVTVEPGQTRVFVTDWRHEKQRNDGTNYYGSHARRLRNTSTEESIIVRMVFGSIRTGSGADYTLVPGQQMDVKADIVEVRALPTPPPFTPPTIKLPGVTLPGVKPPARPRPGIGKAGGLRDLDPA